MSDTAAQGQYTLLVQKNVPFAAFVTGSLLLGTLINEYPPNGEAVAPGIDFKCPAPEEPRALPVVPGQRNHSQLFSSGPGPGFLPKPVVAFITLVLPLLPILAPSILPGGPGSGRNLLRHYEEGQTWKLIVCHAVGQSGSFSTSELARFLIVKPNLQFFDDCKLSSQDCNQIAKEDRSVKLLKLIGRETEEEEEEEEPAKDVLCKNSTSTYFELRENLHGFPDVASALVGAATASFFLSIAARRSNKKKYTSVEKDPLGQEQEMEQVGNNKVASAPPECHSDSLSLKPYLKILFVILSLGALLVLLVDRYSQSKNTPTEMLFSVLMGASFQLTINYFLAGRKKNAS